MTDKQIPNERRQYEYKSVFTYTDNTTDNNDKTMENLHKQIIIDGVDVSECEYYDKNKPLLTCVCEEYPCNECHNCYYKQFKRKEQECKQLKGKLIITLGKEGLRQSDKEFYEQQLDQLKEENRSLKKQLQFEFDETLLQYSNTIEDLQKQLNNTVMQKCPQCGDVYLNPVGCELHEENQQLKAENKELKEELEELKEENEYNEANAIEFKQTLIEIKEIAEKYKTLSFGEQQYCYGEILRKISEVIPNEN